MHDHEAEDHLAHIREEVVSDMLLRVTVRGKRQPNPTGEAEDSFTSLMLEAGCGADPCRIAFKAWFYDRIGASHRALPLYERIRTGGYFGWGLNTGERVWATMRLGALYEAAGDPARADEMYQRVVEQWVGADERGIRTLIRERKPARSAPD